MAKRRKRLTKKERRAVAADSEGYEAGSVVGKAAGKAGLTEQDLAKGLEPDQLQDFTKELASGMTQEGRRSMASEGEKLRAAQAQRKYGEWEQDLDAYETAYGKLSPGEAQSKILDPRGKAIHGLGVNSHPDAARKAYLGGASAAIKGPSKTLDNYLWALGTVYEGTKARDVTQRIDSTRMWTMLRDSRIIEIPTQTYLDVFHEVDVYTCEEIGGDKWRGPTADPPPPGTDHEAFKERIDQAGFKVPFPDALPFPKVFLGLSHTLIFKPEQVGYMLRTGSSGSDDPNMPDQIGLLGLMIGEDYVSEVVSWHTGNTVWASEHPQYHGHTYADTYSSAARPAIKLGWLNPFTLNPWIVSVLIDIVNQHQTLVLEDLGWEARQKWKKGVRKIGIKRPMPPPYYTVHLRDKTVNESFQRTKENTSKFTFKYSYRHDVRAHKRVRVARGQLPLDEKTRKRLQQNPERKIYTIDRPTGEEAHELSKRGIPTKRHDEWMAILTTPIEHHQRPSDPNLPYIPAIRKLSQKASRAVTSVGG